MDITVNDLLPNIGEKEYNLALGYIDQLNSCLEKNIYQPVKGIIKKIKGIDHGLFRTNLDHKIERVLENYARRFGLVGLSATTGLSDLEALEVIANLGPKLEKTPHRDYYK